MTIAYRVLNDPDGIDTVAVINQSRSDLPTILLATETHPNYNTILSSLQTDLTDESVFDLFDVGYGIAKRFGTITERLSYNGSEILWDGDPLHNVHTDVLRRALEAGEQNVEPLAKFIELLESNPNDHSREQAYTWLSTHDFKITDDGLVVGYKSVHVDEDGVFTSINRSGTAFVDGVKHTGGIPNPLGSVVTMPRSEVMHDPNQGCHRGLHVGTWSYASTFGGGRTILEVHVNPRDIVSVPSDAGFTKLRCCRYKVVRLVQAEYTGGSPVLKVADAAPEWQGDVGYKAY